MAQPQTQDVANPHLTVQVNAKWTNGVAPGYRPTAGSGLTLNLSAGTSFLGTTRFSYAGGTLSLTNNATNYVFLDATASNAPAFNTSGYPATGIPLCTVVTISGAITTITDDRTWFGGGFATQAGVQDESYTYAADSGSANAYAVTLSPVPTLVAGLFVVFKAAHANTTSSTLNVNGLGANTIKKIDGATNLASGDIQAGQIVCCIYDGTNFQMESPIGNVPAVGTVTSVALTMPAEFSVAGSPVTSSGTLAVTKANQSPNLVYAGPSSGGAAAPTFRALVAADVPNIAEAQVTGLVSDLALKAPLASPALTGTPTAPTPTIGDDSTKIATTAFVEDAVDNLVAGDIPNIAESQVTGLVSDLALKAPLASPALTGTPTAPTAAHGTNTTQLATTAFVEAEVANGTGLTSVAGITIDGGASTPTTGSKGYIQIPFACTITGWTLLADASGSAQITVKKCSDAGFPTTSSIVASAPPLISSAQKGESSTLTGWTTAITALDILEFNLDSVTTCKRLTLELKLTRT